MVEISRERFITHLERMAEKSSSVLNPDEEDRKMLVDGLLENRERYGYPSCPCRLAAGNMKADRDMICPCDYQPADLEEFGACYCALYVTEEWVKEPAGRQVVPERRPNEKKAI